jgi:hypothetical protein
LAAGGAFGWRYLRSSPSSAAPRTETADARPASTSSAAPAQTPSANGAFAADPKSLVPAQAPAAPASDSSSQTNAARPGTTPTAAGAPAPVVAKGTLVVVAPFQVDVSEKGQALGRGDAGGVSLEVGTHTLDLVNAELGFRTSQTVSVRAGQTVSVQPTVPRGTANLNATPWAEVYIDGERVGETPLGNVSLAIGPHRVEFRHPQLGGQMRTLVVTTQGTARLSVELKQ